MLLVKRVISIKRRYPQILLICIDIEKSSSLYLNRCEHVVSYQMTNGDNITKKISIL